MRFRALEKCALMLGCCAIIWATGCHHRALGLNDGDGGQNNANANGNGDAGFPVTPSTRISASFVIKIDHADCHGRPIRLPPQ